MRVGSIVSEELAGSLLHPEHGGSVHFRNIGRLRSIQHFSVVKAVAYDFTQFVRTKKTRGAANTTARLLVHPQQSLRSAAAGHKHTEPAISLQQRTMAHILNHWFL